MAKCIHIKQKIGYVYCNQLDKQIFAPDCKDCAYFERNISKSDNCTIKTKCYSKSLKKGLKQKSNKLAKLEKNRFSILTDDFTSCIECGRTNVKIDKHEIFGGRNRQISIKMGLVIPFCRICHNSQEKQKKWKAIGQKKYMSYYKKTIEEFKKEFRGNYL